MRPMKTKLLRDNMFSELVNYPGFIKKKKIFTLKQLFYLRLKLFSLHIDKSEELGYTKKDHKCINLKKLDITW